MLDLTPFADDDFCYLTTTGRVTGKPHTIEIWFAQHATTLFLLAGSRERADWVQNLGRSPDVTVRLRSQEFTAHARLVTEADEDALARRLVVAKYERTNPGLDQWGRTALPVALDLVALA